MKSKIIESQPASKNKGAYSELMVLNSAAGYYVGTVYVEHGFEESGSRDSGYFSTKEKADGYLQMVTDVDDPENYLRDAP